MLPIFLLADLYAQSSLSRVAYSARPGAPVLPYEHRRRRHWRLSALRRGRAAPTPARTPVRCLPVT
jgi:hypothetical protein